MASVASMDCPAAVDLLSAMQGYVLLLSLQRHSAHMSANLMSVSMAIPAYPFVQEFTEMIATNIISCLPGMGALTSSPRGMDCPAVHASCE